MNSKRQYHSPARDRAAEETREAIRRSAQELFVEHGYAPTTMKQIARAAGVAERTLYLAYPTKATLLNDLIVRAVRGEGLNRAVKDFPDFSDPKKSWSAERAIEEYVDATAALYSRAGALLVLGDQGAAADPELRSFAENGARDTLRHIHTLTGRLADSGQLRAGLSVPHATDIVYALSHFTTHHLLTTRRRWGQHRYRTWLRGALIEAITTQTQPRPTT